MHIAVCVATSFLTKHVFRVHINPQGIWSAHQYVGNIVGKLVATFCLAGTRWCVLFCFLVDDEMQLRKDEHS